MSPPVLLAGMAACLLAEGFFSGSEIALVSADRVLLRQRAEAGHRGARLAIELLERPEWLLGTCLIGTNLSVVTASTLGAVLVGQLVAEGRLSGDVGLLTTLLVSPLVLLFGEMTPKSVYEHHADRLAPLVVYPLRLFSRLLSPVLLLLEAASRFAVRLTGAPEDAARPVRREEIRLLLEAGRTAEDFEEDEREFIRKVIAFGDSTVREAMVPLIEVVAVPSTATVAEAAHRMIETGYSRLPVYEERVDRITGFVTHRDLLFAEDLEAPAASLARQAPFVPESMRLEDLFRQLQQERQRFAVVVDEYGGATGIITIEDILEEIVGEIEDEFDQEEPTIRRVDEGNWRVEGRAERDELEEELGLELPDGPFETLAGFLLTRFGRIPEVGDTLSWNGWHFTVSRATERAVLEVLVTRIPQPVQQRPRRKR